MIPAIVEQYAQVAAFLWERRCAAVTAPHHDLASLTEADERLDAHLDGLRLAPRTGWSMASRALDEAAEEGAASAGGEVFVAAVLALEAEERGRLTGVIERASEVVFGGRALASALAWVGPGRAANVVSALAVSGSAPLRHVALAASAALRRAPGEWLSGALESGDLALQRRALRAAGEVLSAPHLPLLRARHRDGALDAGARFEAAWSAALLGDPEAPAAACELAAVLAMAGHPLAERACRSAFRLVPLAEGRAGFAALAAAHAKRRRAEASGAQGADALGRLVAITAGAVGDVATAPWLFAAMERAPLARAAAEAFTTITGLAFRGDLRGEAPARNVYTSSPTDDEDDEDVAPDPDAPLPWPRVAAASAWFERAADALPADARLLLGRPIDRALLLSALTHGSQRHRAAAALELTAAHGEPLFETRAPAPRQVRALEAGAAHRRGEES